MTEPAQTITPSNRRYIVGLLLLLSVVNYIDRQLPSILLPSIRRDLALSDTQLGFINGLAFSLFYAIMSSPLGRLADRVSRRKLLAVCTALWSAMTAFSGLATGFATLAIARFGIGIGEAGVYPASASIVSDLYAQKHRGTVFGVLTLGSAFGSLFAYTLGGNMDQQFGWRSAFMIVGLPGLLLAIIAYVTLREPPRGMIDNRVDPGIAPPLTTVAKTLWSIRSYRYCVLATSFTGLANICCTQWSPSFMARSFGASSAEIGNALGPILGIGGTLGGFLGGFLADRLARRDVRWIAWMPAITGSLAVVAGIFTFLAPSSTTAMILLALPVTLLPMHLAAFAAISMGVASLRMRATTPAISLLISAGIIGYGLGPQLIGIVSDLLRPLEGEESLRYALLFIMPLSAAIGAMFFILGSRTLAEDMAAAAER